MPLGLDVFRKHKGGNLDKVRESVLKRGRDPKIVDSIVELDRKWRQSSTLLNKVQSEANKTQKDIGKLMKESKSLKKQGKAEEAKDVRARAEPLKKKIKAFKQEERNLSASVRALRIELQRAVDKVGNLLHPSVPPGSDESSNREVRRVGSTGAPKGVQKPLSHDQLLYRIDGCELEKGRRVAGTRGYFLKGYAMMLNHALQSYGLRFLVQRGYCPVQPPSFVRHGVMERVAQLRTFEEDLYKVVGGDHDHTEKKEDMYLAATSEQPLCALHSRERIEESRLPLLYAGLSTCFRKELTSRGSDARGVFRVHQFEKVEQFALAAPEASWALHERMLQTAEKFYESLNIPFRVVNVAAGALNDAAAKKCDLEGWFPAQGAYRELVSCTNCTDYQSRALEVRSGFPQLGCAHTTQKRFVHMLNSTLCATQRTLCCILENFQTPAGIRVPEPLVTGVGTAFIPFVRDLEVKKQGSRARRGGKTKTKRGRDSANEERDSKARDPDKAVSAPKGKVQQGVT